MTSIPDLFIYLQKKNYKLRIISVPNLAEVYLRRLRTRDKIF